MIKKIVNYILFHTGKKLVIMGIVLASIASILQQIVIRLSSNCMNEVANTSNIEINSILKIIIAFFIYNFVAIVTNVFFSNCNIKFTKSIKKDFLNKLIKSSEKNLSQKTFAEYYEAYTQDSAILDETYQNVFGEIILCVAKIVTAFYVSAKINLWISIFMLLIPILYNFIYTRKQNIMNDLQKYRRFSSIKENDFCNEILTAKTEINGLNAQDRFQEKFMFYSNKFLRIKKISSKFWSVVSACDSLMTQLTPLLLLLVIKNFKIFRNIEIGQIYILLSCLPIFLSFIWIFDIDIFFTFFFSIQNIEKTIENLQFENCKTKTESKALSIKMENININFDEKNVLDGFYCFIKEGEKVLLLGKSGSGKTTLINSLTKRNDNYNGNILLNGKDIKLIDNDYIYSNINCNMQQNFFSGTMFKNLYLISKKKDFETIFKNTSPFNSLQGMMFHSDLNRTLSSGQKKLLAFLQSIVSEKKVLIYDEPFANVDNDNIKKMIKMISQMNDKTVVVIDHNAPLSGFEKIVRL